MEEGVEDSNSNNSDSDILENCERAMKEMETQEDSSKRPRESGDSNDEEFITVHNRKPKEYYEVTQF